jgi:hypothetical protein
MVLGSVSSTTPSISITSSLAIKPCQQFKKRYCATLNDIEKARIYAELTYIVEIEPPAVKTGGKPATVQLYLHTTMY